MDTSRLSAHAKAELHQRNLFLRSGKRSTAVQIRVDDGSPDGFLVGWVEQEPDPFYQRRLTWQWHARIASTEPGYYRGRVNARYSEGNLAGGEESIEKAIQEVLYLASYGDILAAREVESGRAGAYTTTMDESQADWLASLDEPKGITHLGGGKLRLTNIAVAYFRGSPQHGSYVDANYLLYLDPMDEPYQLIREP
ncbi:hypothetical protein AB0L54_36860 [Streptomyces sp. NPDC052196]|uniref:hypothetical protein n=1 Tax=Streptomyces sp. NPDC052196 TaxID=3156691 RepID=UPI003430829E